MKNTASVVRQTLMGAAIFCSVWFPTYGGAYQADNRAHANVEPTQRLVQPQVLAPVLALRDADGSDIVVSDIQAGQVPFISFLHLRGQSLANVLALSYTITPRAGAHAKPVHVRYTVDALRRRGQAPKGDAWTLPVFGLYAGQTNAVTVSVMFQDASTQVIPVSIAAAEYVDPYGVFNHPTVIRARDPHVTLGFDYMFLKSGLGSPVVIDTDGVIRWISGGNLLSLSSIFINNGFIVGDWTVAALHRLELDGTVVDMPMAMPAMLGFHHNLDMGKQGLFANVNLLENGILSLQETIAEITDTGTVLRQWDFAKLIGDYMVQHGDNPTSFIRPGLNWLHLNSSLYDPADDGIIVSSREHFIMKINYSTGAISWILGDPTKYWYTFPSLRAKALTLPKGDLYPIGQHSVSFTSDGLLMVFNNGAPTFNSPAFAPPGRTRKYSAVSAYSIDVASMTAHEVWRFDYDKSIKSAVCSSVYEAAGKSLLVDYATADRDTHTRLVGLDANHHIAFDYEYAESSCNTGWNAMPIQFDNLFFN